MAEFKIGVPVETDTPTIEVTVDQAAPLAVGTHVFQLIVLDDSKNASVPTAVKVTIRDSILPTAILNAPSQVEFGQSFVLDARKSSDVPPGKVVRYVYTLMD
jgi:hypothetical protein